VIAYRVVALGDAVIGQIAQVLGRILCPGSGKVQTLIGPNKAAFWQAKASVVRATALNACVLA
jgi:hypothetical protein